MSFIENKNGKFVCMTAPNIETVHGFTTRFGGVSSDVFSSLNLGQGRGDKPERVRENYSIICEALGLKPDDIVCSKQVHGTRIRVVTRNDCGGLFRDAREEADGMITDKPGVALVVYTADCVPILLHDPQRAVIGAVHAGWRGTAGDIIGFAIDKMRSEYGSKPRDIKAAIGPCISKCCYETGSDVANAVRSLLGEGAERFITPRGDTGKYMTDLKGINRELLIRAGVLSENIEISDECTSCASEKYWSHRVTGGIRGSQAAVIALKGNAL